MAGRWLFKTEPSEYSYERLEKDGRTVWDGVTNALALRHLREVRRGDEILIYHTGDEKAVVGLARAISDPRPDPGDASGKRVVVEIEPQRRLPRPVPLAGIKARRDMADFDLVRLGRLSVMPVSSERWEAILAMSRSGAPSRPADAGRTRHTDAPTPRRPARRSQASR
jgi:predicted RNA-binding protein with PUA-like domain